MMKLVRKKINRIKQDKGQTIVFTVYFILFVVFSFAYIYPLFWCFINSLKSPMEYFENANALPSSWNILIYREIFKSFKIGSNGFWSMTWNSVWQAFGGQGLNVLASLFVAYPLARYEFPGKKFFYWIIIFKITIPIIGAGAAAYKFYRALGMINNPLMFMITYFNGFDFAALIMYGYFKNISKEYSEAAFIDGATKMQTMLFVVMPQAFPCVLALYISNVMKYWNVYSTSQIYLPKYPNLALGIYEFEKSALFAENGTSKFFGSIILSSLVPMILFGLGQKTMLENMSVGGLKG